MRWENGALLSVTNGLGYPDLAAGSNDQGLLLYCEGRDGPGMIRHDDHDRGVSYAYLDGIGPGGSHFNYVSPDFFRLVPWEGEGMRPVGYGYDSIEAIVESACRVERAGEGLSEAAAREARRRGHPRGGRERDHRHPVRTARSMSSPWRRRACRSSRTARR